MGKEYCARDCDRSRNSAGYEVWNDNLDDPNSYSEGRYYQFIDFATGSGYDSGIIMRAARRTSTCGQCESISSSSCASTTTTTTTTTAPATLATTIVTILTRRDYHRVARMRLLLGCEATTGRVRETARLELPSPNNALPSHATTSRPSTASGGFTRRRRVNRRVFIDSGNCTDELHVMKASGLYIREVVDLFNCYFSSRQHDPLK